jgi:hypothetical protein
MWKAIEVYQADLVKSIDRHRTPDGVCRDFPGHASHAGVTDFAGRWARMLQMLHFFYSASHHIKKFGCINYCRSIRCDKSPLQSAAVARVARTFERGR